MIRFEPILLASADDCDARLVFQEDRLAAIVSRLGDLHDGLAGYWFVEAVFDGVPRPRADPFPALDDVASWIGERG